MGSAQKKAVTGDKDVSSYVLPQLDFENPVALFLIGLQDSGKTTLGQHLGRYLASSPLDPEDPEGLKKTNHIWVITGSTYDANFQTVNKKRGWHDFLEWDRKKYGPKCPYVYSFDPKENPKGETAEQALEMMMNIQKEYGP